MKRQAEENMASHDQRRSERDATGNGVMDGVERRKVR